MVLRVFDDLRMPVLECRGVAVVITAVNELAHERHVVEGRRIRKWVVLDHLCAEVFLEHAFSEQRV